MGDGRPDREFYRAERPGVQQELAHHYRDKDMRDDYEAFTKVKTKEEMRIQRAEFRGTFLFTILFIGISGLAIAYLW